MNAWQHALMAHVTKRAYKIDEAQAPRLAWLMKYAFLALAACRSHACRFAEFLLEKKYRDRFLAKLPTGFERLKYFFDGQFPKTRGGAKMWALPLINKLKVLMC